MNLSSVVLSKYELCILSKGLSFIPKPKRLDHVDLLRDANNLIGKMKTMYERYNKPRRERSPFYRKPTRTQHRHWLTDNQALENIAHGLKMRLASIQYEQIEKDNLSYGERKALTDLMSRTDIVINKADKGSTIVVIDRDDYVRDALEHLADQSVYQQLASDTTGDTKQMISKKLDKLMRSGMLDKDMHTYCEPPVSHRTSRLYFLKKIHKNPMKIRPIVSSCNSVTENISEFVDHWLQPEMRKLPSHLKDTNAFTNLIETTKLPDNCILTSIDVSSLYTNIPHDEGKRFAMEALANSDPTPGQPPPEVIGELIDLVLKNNIFEFDGKHYLQIQGTAMGTKMAPAYANLFMGKIEDQLRSIGGDNILLWKRFIDDIFLVWTGTEDELRMFLSDINKVHRTIQFTWEISHSEITFLDTTLYKGPRFMREGTLDIRTHIKPTNKQLYVHASSYHPPGTRKGIAIGEAKRYLIHSELPALHLR